MRDNRSPAAPGAAPTTPRRPAGTLEAAVLATLRAAGRPLTPGQVRRRLADGQPEVLSYSTVVTIMSRLHAKGLLARERAGRAFAYTPVDDAAVAASRMNKALETGSDRDAVLTRFVSGLSGKDARLLRSLLAGQHDGRPSGGRGE